MVSPFYIKPNNSYVVNICKNITFMYDSAINFITAGYQIKKTKPLKHRGYKGLYGAPDRA